MHWARKGVGHRILGLASPSGLRARLTIFTFHRVLGEPDPLLPDDITRSDFEQRARWIAELCNVLPLYEAAQRLMDGTLPRCAACVTFDDGYADNETNAVPILRALGIPASIFVAVDAIKTGVMWNDIVLEAVRLGGTALDTKIVGIPAGDLPASHGTATFAGRLLKLLKYRPVEQRWELATQLYRSVSGRDLPSRQMLTVQSIRRLATMGIDIGGHTISHPILAGLPKHVAKREIEGCREWIESATGESPVSFAYPNGKPGSDYGERDVRLVRDAGFHVAVSTRWASATARSNILELPRIAPNEASPTMFLGRLLRTCLAG